MMTQNNLENDSIMAELDIHLIDVSIEQKLQFFYQIWLARST